MASKKKLISLKQIKPLCTSASVGIETSEELMVGTFSWLAALVMPIAITTKHRETHLLRLDADIKI